jgi:hypothetical protein
MNEYAVLDSIYHLSNNIKYGGWAIISRQRMADDLDLSKRNIIYIINALELKGLVIRDEKTKFLRASEVYCKMIQNKSEWAIANNETKIVSVPTVKNLHQEDENIASQGVKNLHSNGEKIAPNNNIDNNRVNNNKDNNINTCFSFESFWNLYPNKNNKKGCESKYKKLTESQRAKISATLPSFLAYKPFASYTPPHPLTYLNQERWEDEIKVKEEKIIKWD